ncbi:hypothetical protein Tco_0687594 [Tanacetum coccineum]
MLGSKSFFGVRGHQEERIRAEQRIGKARERRRRDLGFIRYIKYEGEKDRRIRGSRELWHKSTIRLPLLKDQSGESKDGFTEDGGENKFVGPNQIPIEALSQYSVSKTSIVRIGQYTVSEDPILRIGQYSVSEEPILCIGQYSISEEPILRTIFRGTIFWELPYPFDYPMRRLTMEEILAKFIDEGRREHEEMEIFIKEF